MALSNEPPLSEPLIVPCLYVTDTGIEIDESMVRIVGWVRLPDVAGTGDENRIVVRFALTSEAARKLSSRLLKALARGGH